MILIKIDGKELYIPQDTTLCLEMSNSLFNTEKIEGEIIFTFDVPAYKNDVIFQHARYLYVKRLKSYEAVISVGGIEIAKGNLIIQQAKPNSYSCGVVMNPYPAGFTDKMLKDNDYGVLGQLGKEYKQGTVYYTPNGDGYSSKITHLGVIVGESLETDSNIKFGEFYDEDFFGEMDTPTGAKVKVWQHCVNHFALQLPYYELIDRTHTSPPIGSFYDYNIKMGMAPQIKLLYLLNLLLKTASYKLIGSVLRDEKMNRIFYQSLRAIFYVQVLETEINLKNHTPSLSNADFINTFCQLFGCTYYLDSTTKQIEISLAKDLHKTKSIDLRKYLIENETIIEHKENTRYTYQLDCIESQDIQETYTLPPVDDSSQLPNAAQNIEKIGFVKNANAYYTSQYNDKTQRWEWVLFSGNTKTISNQSADGNNAGTIIKPNAKIPTCAMNAWTNRRQLAEIPLKSVNQPEPSDSADFELILNYYVTEQSFYYAYGVGRCSYLIPIHASLPLTVDDENSLGQIYAMPYLKLLGNHEPITMQFLFPIHIFLEVRNLLKPQNVPTNQQTRWIMVNNIKMLPIQMKFEFTVGKRFVKGEIKMAKIDIGV